MTRAELRASLELEIESLTKLPGGQMPTDWSRGRVSGIKLALELLAREAQANAQRAPYRYEPKEGSGTFLGAYQQLVAYGTAVTHFDPGMGKTARVSPLSIYRLPPERLCE